MIPDVFKVDYCLLLVFLYWLILIFVFCFIVFCAYILFDSISMGFDVSFSMLFWLGLLFLSACFLDVFFIFDGFWQLFGWYFDGRPHQSQSPKICPSLASLAAQVKWDEARKNRAGRLRVTALIFWILAKRMTMDWIIMKPLLPPSVGMRWILSALKLVELVNDW